VVKTTGRKARSWAMHPARCLLFFSAARAVKIYGGGVLGGGGDVGGEHRAGDGDVEGGDGRVVRVEGDDEVDLRGGPAGGAGEAAMEVVEGVQVGGGGLADDPGEDVVALNAAGRGTAGGLVVGVGDEVVEGGGEAALSRGVAGAARVAPQWERRREEGERDA